MNEILWMLTGAGALFGLSAVAAAVVDRDFLREAGGFLLGVLAAPAIAVVALLRALDIVGSVRLSGHALARFADMRQKENLDLRAWTFAYGGCGIIFVRKAPRS